MATGTELQRRGYKIFQVLLLNKKFKPFVRNARKDLGIPKEGFDIKEDWQKVEGKYIAEAVQFRDIVSSSRVVIPSNKSRKDIDNFISENNIEERFEKDFGLFADSMITAAITEYIVFSRVAFMGSDIGQVTISEYNEKDMSEEIVFHFMAEATKNEMIEFIERNWELIEMLKDKIVDKDRINKRKKLAKNFGRDVHIYNLYQILKKSNSDGYKEIKLSEALKKDRINLDEGTIRAIIARIDKAQKEINK